MVHTVDWTAAFNNLPPDSEVASSGASRIRTLKTALTERMQIDHIWQDGTSTDGFHQQVTLKKSAADPSNVADYGFVYTKDVGSGVIELFYEDHAGNVIQLTDGGSLNSGALEVTNLINTDTNEQTDNYTMLATDIGGTILMNIATAKTLTLIAAASAGDGGMVIVKKTSSQVVGLTIDGNSAETIDGAANKVLYAEDHAVVLVSDGSNWHIVAEYLPKPTVGDTLKMYASSTTVTVPKWATTAEIEGWGAGGSGSSSGGAGAGGTYTMAVVAVTPGDTLTITIDGTSSRVLDSGPTTLMTAPVGGNGSGTSGGAPGSTGTGTFSRAGGPGGNRQTNSPQAGGVGGGSPFGGAGGSGNEDSATGEAGCFPGGGGGGGEGGSTSSGGGGWVKRRVRLRWLLHLKP
jgi:hypothetical protein